ncbi:MAG TPA: glycosyltransferase family 4 protein [Stellaceae bacterium]|jgi:glycosyltransferase involved in cell wall biosynthesis
MNAGNAPTAAAAAQRRPRPKILFVVTEDWYFCSHRLPMARAARDLGCEVVVATRVDSHGEAIGAEGFRLVPLRRLDRRSADPLREAAAVRELYALYRRERPDLVHHVALKPVLYGALAARLAGVPSVVNALAGLGFVFASATPAARLLRPAVTSAFRFLLDRPGSRLLVQNEDDRAFFAGSGLVAAERIALVRGSGVDIARLAPTPDPAAADAGAVPIAALVGRMLWDKGVGEAVEASRKLRQRGVALRLALVGRPDPANPRSIPEATLRGWQAEGVAEWWGHRDDIAEIWRHASIALLPSYREGLPKALLEAAACGRPMLATDVPGCRELVRHEANGLLVPVRDAAALADALARLAADPALRRRLGAAARRTVEGEYAETAIAGAVQALYREMLGNAGAPAPQPPSAARCHPPATA